MNKSRLEQLKTFLEESPHDPFLIYAIAIEYQKTDLEKARGYFDQLLREHPDYLPAYYHAANLFATMDQRDRAIDTFKKGIEVAQHQKDDHTLRELNSAYEEFLFEEE